MYDTLSVEWVLASNFTVSAFFMPIIRIDISLFKGSIPHRHSKVQLFFWSQNQQLPQWEYLRNSLHNPFSGLAHCHHLICILNIQVTSIPTGIAFLMTITDSGLTDRQDQSHLRYDEDQRNSSQDYSSLILQSQRRLFIYKPMHHRVLQ